MSTDSLLVLIGVIPTLLLFQQPFGINALVGLIALSGILMRNTLILIGQIRSNEKDGLAPFDAVVEARVLTLVFLPALYAIWFKIKPAAKGEHSVPEIRTAPVPA